LSENNKLNYSFKNTGLVCGDELTLDPISGSLPPKQFIEVNIKN
jgi:hypothetical protein